MTIEQYTAAVKEYRNAYLQEIEKNTRRRPALIEMGLFVKKLSKARPATGNDEESDKVMLREEIETKHKTVHRSVAGKKSTCKATGEGVDFKPNLCTCGYEIFTFGANCGELAGKQILIQLFTGYIAGFKIEKEIEVEKKEGKKTTKVKEIIAEWYLYENLTEGEMDATRDFLTSNNHAIRAEKGANIDYSKLPKRTFRQIALVDLGTAIVKNFAGVVDEQDTHILPLVFAEPARNAKLFELVTAIFKSPLAFKTEISKQVGQVWSSGYGKASLNEEEIKIIKSSLTIAKDVVESSPM